MELNREQIIKALECCVKAETHLDCRKLKCPALINDECVYIGETDEDCDRQQLADALSLINSQEQRIKELAEEKDKLGLLIDELEKEKRELWEERNRIYNDLQDWKAISEQYQKQFEDCAEDRAKLTEENERLREDVVAQLEAEVDSSDKYIAEYDGSEVQKAYNKGLRDALKIAKEMLEGV